MSRWDAIDEAEQGQLYGRILALVGGALGDRLRSWRATSCSRSDTATTVRVDREGATTVTDGPFVEAKEMVGGYAIIDVPDLDAAIALVRTWPAPDILEIRPVMVREGMGA